MAQFEIIPDHVMEPLAKCLGECGSGTDITRMFHEQHIVDGSGESTKRRRLYHAFLQIQRKSRSSNQIFGFIQSFLAPAKFVGRKEDFEDKRGQLNAVLSFVGIEFGSDGQFRKAQKSRTLEEAEKRLKTIQSKLRGRSIHSEVLKYCRAELMQGNYFHAVFESSKGLAQRIRELSGADGDGSKLIDRVFLVDRPLLALNSLQTETERSEHKGFAQLLKGCFAAVRNPLAHEPRILWNGEVDAADYFSLISLLHRRLDDCVKVPVKLK